MTQKVDFLVDWLEFTYLVPEDAGGLTVWENFMEDFPEFANNQCEMVMDSRGRNGYTHCFMFCDEYTVLYNPDEQRMGVHVTFPSHGLYRMCEMFGLSGLDDFVSIKSLLTDLKSRSCRVTRMDICYDDYSKTFTPHDFGKWMMNGQISTKSRVWSFMSSQAGSGATFYLGKRGSDRFIRIYDKDYESKGRIPAIRYEFELRKAYVDMIVNKVINGIEFSFADLIENTFCIMNEYEKSGDRDVDYVRKLRAGSLSIWEEFLEVIRMGSQDEVFVKHAFIKSPIELKVDTKKREVSFKKIHNWITVQVLPSLYIFKECLGEQRLNDMISAQEGRLNILQRKMLDKYKVETSADLSI